MWADVLSGNYSLREVRVARAVSLRPFCRSTTLCGGRHRWKVINVSRYELAIFDRHMMHSRMRATWKTLWDGWELQWISHLRKLSPRRASTWALQFSPIRYCLPSNIEISMQYLRFSQIIIWSHHVSRNKRCADENHIQTFCIWILCFYQFPKATIYKCKAKEKRFKHNKTLCDLNKKWNAEAWCSSTTVAEHNLSCPAIS